MRLFNFKKKQKPVVITIHGFGKRMHHQFDSISDFLRTNGYDVIQFDLFDYNNYQDVDYKIWIERAEQQVREAQKKYHNNIVLFGYSMGGVIATYLATVFPVKKLILSAPAYQYMDMGKIVDYGINSIKKAAGKPLDPDAFTSLQTKAFQDVVAQCKQFIPYVDCPVFLMHGSDDQTIALESSKKAFQQFKCEKNMVTVEGGGHHMFYQQPTEHFCHQLVLMELESIK